MEICTGSLLLSLPLSEMHSSLSWLHWKGHNKLSRRRMKGCTLRHPEKGGGDGGEGRGGREREEHSNPSALT